MSKFYFELLVNSRRFMFVFTNAATYKEAEQHVRSIYTKQEGYVVKRATRANAHNDLSHYFLSSRASGEVVKQV